ncbi:MAG: hypothetical protein AAF984_01375 [Verrucomicrobiota bacterium]
MKNLPYSFLFFGTSFLLLVWVSETFATSKSETRQRFHTLLERSNKMQKIEQLVEFDDANDGIKIVRRIRHRLVEMMVYIQTVKVASLDLDTITVHEGGLTVPSITIQCKGEKKQANYLTQLVSIDENGVEEAEQTSQKYKNKIVIECHPLVAHQLADALKQSLAK